MIKDIRRVGIEVQVVSARSTLVEASRTAAVSTQPTHADAAAATTTSATTTATAASCSTTAFHFRTNPNHFSHAHVQADTGRAGANAKGDDFFVGAERVGVEAAKFSVHHVCLAATRSESGARIELVVPRQIAADRYVIRRARVVSEKRRQRDSVRRREVP